MPSSKPTPGQSLADFHPELCKEWSPRNELPPTEYKRGSEKKVYWRCSDKCHEFSAIISNRTAQGQGCPYCSGNKPILHETDLLTLEPKLCQEWSPRNDLSPTEFMRYSNKKVLWVCSKGQHEFSAAIASRTGRGTGCPYCSGQQVLQGFNDLLTLEPELCQEWDYFKNELSPTRYTKNSGKKVWWICPDKGHEYFARIAHRSDSNKRSGCPYCYGRYPILHETDLLTLYPNIKDIWSSKNKYPPEHYTKNSGKSVLFICKEHNTEYKQVIRKYTSGQNGCQKCQHNSTSIIEQYMSESLGASNRYKLPNTSEVSKRKTWEVDAYLVDQNFVVEFDGAYFHSLKGAYTRDRNKTLDLLKQGFKVIRIRDCYPPYKLKSLRIKHPNYHELYWEHNESTYPNELPDELLDKVRDICYS